jgi:hypothetical protein
MIGADESAILGYLDQAGGIFGRQHRSLLLGQHPRETSQKSLPFAYSLLEMRKYKL